MPKCFVVTLIVFGLLGQGCASHQSVTQAPVAASETICWDPPPEKPAHPVLAWCKTHPWTVGVGTGLLVVGGIVAAGAIALSHGGGAALVMAGMH
jgi:hypothetical protein